MQHPEGRAVAAEALLRRTPAERDDRAAADEPDAEADDDAAHQRVRRDEAQPSWMSRNVWVKSMRRSWRSRVACGIGSRHTISADTRNVHASTTSASDLLIELERTTSASNAPSHAATRPASANTIDASGNVPYAATSESEFAEVSCSFVTRFGTDASFAGPHSSVSISSTNEISDEAAAASRRTAAAASSDARPRSQQHHHLAAVQPVDEHAADRCRGRSPGTHAGHHHEADRGTRVVGDARARSRGSR